MAHAAPASSPGIPRTGLRPDLIAGLTAAAVVLPKAMAYATVAGLPVSVGLYTAFVPLIVYAFLGTSRVLSVSSTTTLAILTAAQLALVVPDGDPARLVLATATLTALTGGLLVAASVLRLGFVANFISLPVLTGFKAGIGLVIVLDQIPKLLGVHIAKEGFFHDVVSVAASLPHASATVVAVGGGALALLMVAERLRPHSPAPLLIVAGGIAVSWAAGLGEAGVDLVGHIPRFLPSVTLPDGNLVVALLPGAAGIALMSFTETIAAGRAFAAPSEPPVRPNRELVATGAANLAGALFGAMPAGGGTSQTAIVRAVGGRTQVASLVTAAASAATMLVLAPLLGLLPQAVLAAIVIVYSVGLIRPGEFAAILKVRWMEFGWAVVALLGVLVFGTLQGILVAILVSMLSLASQVATPRIHVIGRKRGADLLRPLSPDNPDDETFEGLLILRPEGRLFFTNAQAAGDRIRELVKAHRPRVLLVDLGRVFDLEYSALQMMVDGERRFAEEGLTVWIAVQDPVILRSLRASGLADRLGEGRIFPNTRAAIRAYLGERAAPAGEGALPPA